MRSYRSTTVTHTFTLLLTTLLLNGCSPGILSGGGDLGDMERNMSAVEGQLKKGSQSAAACMTYLDLCEAATSICLAMGQATSFKKTCNRIVSRCQSNLTKFCPNLPKGADTGGAAPPDGGVPPSSPDSALPPPPPVKPDSGGGTGVKCTLTASGPLSSTKAGQVFKRLRITSTNGAALTITHDNVVVREVEILHSGGPGIRLNGGDNVTIEDVSITHTGAPAKGANTSDQRNNIVCYGAQSPTVKRARLTRGSSGIYLVNCPGSKLSFIEGRDFRGPFPRGQLVQWDKSSNGLLEDFSVINPAGSWPEDNVNVYKCDNITIRRGHIDGNNSPSGVGVIFDGGNGGGLVEDVDAIRMGNGCFSNYEGANGTVFRRVGCRQNICGDQGRGKPLSNALMFAGNPNGASCKLEDARYWASCNNNLVWPSSSFSVQQLKKVDFKMRPPISNSFCWE